jgi:hypothetical protein
MNVPTPEDKDKEIPHSKSLPTQESEKYPSQLIRRRKSTGERHNYSAGVFLCHIKKIADPVSQQLAFKVEKVSQEELAVNPDHEAVPDNHSYPATTPITP